MDTLMIPLNQDGEFVVNRDFDIIENLNHADMKEFFKARNIERKAELDARKTEDDKKVVTDAISKYASGLKFAEGWTLDDAVKLGDFSKVQNDENIIKKMYFIWDNSKPPEIMYTAKKHIKRPIAVFNVIFSLKNKTPKIMVNGTSSLVNIAVVDESICFTPIAIPKKSIAWKVPNKTISGKTFFGALLNHTVIAPVDRNLKEYKKIGA